MTNDSEILDLLFARSDEGVRQLQEKYGRLCRTVAWHLLHDESEAEECVNDALLGVWNAIPPARPQVLSAFVCRIARNLALKRLEYLSAAKRSRSLTLYLEELEEWGQSAVEDEWDDRALSECINQFLGGLSESRRRVFVLRYWYNFDVGEIAARCGFSVSKTESMLHRTRKKLKQHLMEMGYLNDKK